MSRAKFLNVSLIGTFLFVSLLSILSLAPMLICSIIILVCMVEMAVHIGYKMTDNEMPLEREQALEAEEQGIEVKDVKASKVDKNKKRTVHEVLSDDGKNPNFDNSEE